MNIQIELSQLQDLVAVKHTADLKFMHHFMNKVWLRIDEESITSLATDRYAIATLTVYPSTNPGFTEPVFIGLDETVLKHIASLKLPKYGHAFIDLIIESVTDYATLNFGSVSLTVAMETKSDMFDRCMTFIESFERSETVQVLSLNPKKLAELSKISNTAWVLNTSASQTAGKPAPVMFSTFVKDGNTYRYLLQPNYNR